MNPQRHLLLARLQWLEISAEGMTIIVVTHEMAFARLVWDQVIFMTDGVVVEAGIDDDVFVNCKR